MIGNYFFQYKIQQKLKKIFQMDLKQILGHGAEWVAEHVFYALYNAIQWEKGIQTGKSLFRWSKSKARIKGESSQA